MKKQVKEVFNILIIGTILFAFTGCNMGFNSSSKPYTSITVKTTVAKSIDQQMDYIKPQLDSNLQSSIDNGLSKGSGPLNGEQIVELTLKEENGENYIDFCYDVNMSYASTSVEDVMESARPLMSEDQFNSLQQNAKSIEKSIMEFGNNQSKTIRTDQQEAFYKDLKSLVTKTVVMMTAGVVYMVIPDTVLWGKVSAAAAIAIGAGLVANVIMTIYQKYKVGTIPNEDMSVADWLKELIKEPKAEYAIAAAAFATAATVTENPVARGIVVCVFGLSESYKLFKEISKKYDFNL